MTIKGKKIGFVGAGKMGEAMIKGLLAANLVPPTAICATDVRLERLKELDRQYGIQIAADNPELVRHADVVILAVKPQIIEPVLREVAHALTRRKLMISIAAGVSTARLRTIVGKDARLIRVMPNTPALVLEGVTAIAKAEGLESDDLDTAGEIFSAVGRVVVLDEELLDAVTGLSGSGPAYVALVIESLADGGVKMGLDRITAMTLATQTVPFITRVTEPVLGPIRDRLRLPTVAMGLDLSPMVVLLAIYFLKSFLVGSLHDIAASLR